MPVIRQIEAQRGLGGAPRPSIQVDDGIARGLSQLGNSLENAAAAEQEMQLRLQRHNMQVQEFRVDQQFRQFDAGMGTAFVEAQQNMDPSGVNLTENFVKQFDAKAEEYLTTVPEALRPKMAELVQTSRAGWVDKVAVAERDQRYNWYRTGITESQEKLQGQVFNDPELYEAAREDGYRAINTSGLPEAEKEELRRQWDDVLSVTVAEREIREAELNPSTALGAGARLGIPGANGDAPVAGVVERIIEVESGGSATAQNPRSTASGLGQFTDSTWIATVERHRPDLAARLSRSELLALKTDPTIAREMTFRHTEDNATALRASGLEPTAGNLYLAHFAGIGGAEQVLRASGQSLVETVLGAGVVRANPFLEGKTVAWLKGWANRKMEGAEGGVEPDQRYASLSLDKRLEIYDRVQAAEGRGRAALDAQRKAIQSSTYDSLTLGIETGDVVSDQTILGARAIDDGQKATLLKALRTKRDETAGVNELISAITTGQGVQVNSFDGDQTKIAEKAHEQMLKATPEENRQSVTRAFIQQTGYIPKGEIAVVRQGAASADFSDFTNSMLRARNLKNAAPEHFANAEGLSNVRRDLERFEAYTENMGYSAEEAGRRILQSRTEEAQLNEEVLGPQADKILKEVTAKEVASYFDPGIFTSEPGPGADVTTQNMLLSDFRQAFRDRFLQTGDEDEAKALAAKDLKKTWGMTNVSGDRELMKYPPEKFYPAVAGGHDYLRTDAVETATEIGGGEPSNVYLRPWIDPATGRNLTAEDIRAGRLPRYRLIYEREENGQRIIDMAPTTWAVPAQQVQTLSEAAQEKAMQEARESREFQATTIAPVVNEVFPAVKNMVEGRQLPSVEAAKPAAAAGAAMGAVAPRSANPGAETFTNDQTYYGSARTDSPLGRAIRRRRELDAQGQAIREKGVR